MPLGPQRLARGARVDPARRVALHRLEIQAQPVVGPRAIDIAPLAQIDASLPSAQHADQILLVPAREDDEFARRVVHSGPHHRGVPLQTVLAHDGRIGLHRIFVKIVEYEAVDAVARKRTLAADREDAAVAPHDLGLVGGAEVLRRLSPALYARRGKDLAVLRRLDDTLHAAVELIGQRRRIGGYGHPPIGIETENIGGQQRARPDALAVLRRHGYHEFADAPRGEGLQQTVIGGVKGAQLQKGVYPSGEVDEPRLADRRDVFLLLHINDRNIYAARRTKNR